MGRFLLARPFLNPQMNVSLTIAAMLCALTLAAQTSSHLGAPKYAPPADQKLLIIGQDLGAVGGLDNYADGYVDNLEQIPAGVTTYTGIPGLAGLISAANWGAGDVDARQYLQDETFQNSCIVIGLFINNQLQLIVNGTRDSNLIRLADWIKSTNRPVFLRIGYEFDGPWNGLDPEAYKQAWIYIVELFDREEVRNVAYVWQAAGINTSNINRWYPGDEYVNWLAYSHFDENNPGRNIREFAEAHSKPIMIAESTPRVDLKTQASSTIWEDWYAPLFETIHANPAIKALAYINVNWDSQSQWQGQGWGDSRVQVNGAVKENWLAETSQDDWLKASETLFEQLDYQLWQDSLVTIEEPPVTSLNDALSWNITKAKNEWLVSLTANQEFTLALYGLDGRLWFETTSADNQVRFDENQLKGSVFMLSITSPDGTIRKKIQLIEE